MNTGSSNLQSLECYNMSKVIIELRTQAVQGIQYNECDTDA
jgi:hypothetical protein